MMMLLDILLSQVLRERICVWKVSYQLLFVIFDLLNAHLDNLVNCDFHVGPIIIYGFLNFTAPSIAVDVSSRDVREYFQMLALLR